MTYLNTSSSTLNAGFVDILYRISINNGADLKYTHKEVRAYARIFLVCLDELSLSGKSSEVAVLLVALSKYGLPHRDRSFIASQVFEIIKEIERENNQRKFEDSEYCEPYF